MLKNVYRNTLLFLISPCKISLVWVPWVLCLGGFILSLPNYSSTKRNPDLEVQYEQVMSGIYGDWHPPIMSATWRFIMTCYKSLTGTEAACVGIFYAFQTLLVWTGILLILLHGYSFWKGKNKSWFSVFAVIALLSWIFLDVTYQSYHGFITKDILMLGAYLIATGLLLNWPKNRYLKFIVVFVVLFFLFYGTALRHNAMFALIPLIFFLIWRILPKKSFLPVVFLGLVVWGVMIVSIHYYNYGILKAVKLYPLQERFYADIFLLNASDPKTYKLPPNTFNNNFERLDKDLFLNKYNHRDKVFIEAAFTNISQHLPEKFLFCKNNDVIILSSEKFEKMTDKYATRMNDLGRKSGPLIALNEAEIRETYPKDYPILRKAWIEHILESPVKYLQIKITIFVKYCLRTGMFFMGLSVASIAFIDFFLTFVFTCSSKRMTPSVFPALMMSWSAFLYLAPLVIFLTDDHPIRYVYWVYAATYISVALFLSESELFRSISRLIINDWETRIRTLAVSPPAVKPVGKNIFVDEKASFPVESSLP